MLAPTAVLDERVSTGLGALDAVLGGLYWGDNVVWQLDGAPIAPFYRAIASQSDVFDTKTVVSLGRAVNTYGIPGASVLEAPRAPADLLREIMRLCHPRAHRLLLFGPLDAMVRAWGANAAREFFARCCPLLLEVGAIAYWCMSARAPVAVRETVYAVTPCVLRVDDHNVHVAKAEARDDAIRGSVLQWHEADGLPVLSPPEIVGRVAASLKAVRRARGLSQHDLGDMAGVTASAISQAERGERGLGLATLVRLSSALHVTIDDLLHGEDRGVYRIGRRSDDPQHGFDHTLTLLDDEDPSLHIELVHLGARETGAPGVVRQGRGLIAVASGLVQLTVAGQTPALRHGEVLVTDASQVAVWSNLGQSDAVLFWIVATP
jgi:transcriptional regulator with XRE-family HTH domain